jgi:MazG family protein
LNSEQTGIDELLRIMARLRDPQGGCPWDLEQDFLSIAPYTLEEAYEVADAIERDAPDDLREELGDLLFQVVYHAQMAAEKDWFDFTDVVAAINEKMIRRHPHVFGDEEVADAAEQSEAWEHHKAKERAGKSAQLSNSVLDGVPLALPALVRAQKIQRRAARVGFDWKERAEVMAKLEEELGELNEALSENHSLNRVHEELGDLLFSCVNLARFVGADAETLLRQASNKFSSRFRMVESMAAEQEKNLSSFSLEQLEALWQKAKRS